MVLLSGSKPTFPVIPPVNALKEMPIIPVIPQLSCHSERIFWLKILQVTRQEAGFACIPVCP
jgi:hypothetical protein